MHQKIMVYEAEKI